LGFGVKQEKEPFGFREFSRTPKTLVNSSVEIIDRVLERLKILASELGASMEVCPITGFKKIKTGIFILLASK
jgi:hypothetical protein